MKKLFICFSVVLMLLLFVSCATVEFDNSLLQATNTHLDTMLPNLQIAGSTNETTVIDNNKSISTSSYLYTIWQRELENNICDYYGPQMGRIEMTIANAKVDIGEQSTIRLLSAATGGSLIGAGVVFGAYSIDQDSKDLMPVAISSLTLGSALAFVPLFVPGKIKYYFDVEVRIYANNGQQVWRKQFILDEVKKCRPGDEEYRAVAGSTDITSIGNAKTNLTLKAFKKVVEDIKTSLNADRETIVKRLEENNK